ncbi:MAG: LD-carboxypeptidase [Myxococcales bacterium]|nr:LD-carboxypeptidase [Myxococcales bacterium]
MLTNAPLIAPPPLAPGQILAIAAPAGPVSPERLRLGLTHLNAFRLAMRPDIERKAGYLAGDDQLRIDEFNAYLRDPDVRAIMMARGGYGLMRILPHLDEAAFRADPKPIIGFSDGTALHAWVMACGYQAIHGPVVTQLGGLDAASVNRLLQVMTTPEAAPPIALQEAQADASGIVVGGNLSLLCHLMGTPWQVAMAERLVFLEDVGEAPYRIDRMLTQLSLAGALHACYGLVAGDFTRCGDNASDDDGRAANALLRAAAAAAATPFACGLPVGHGQRNQAFYVGARGEIRVDKRQLAFVTG